MAKYEPGKFEKLLEEAHPDVKEIHEILVTVVGNLIKQIGESYEERTKLIKMVEEIREGLEKLKKELDLEAFKRLVDALNI